MADAAQRLSAYQEDGYTIFKGLFSEAQLEAWREAYPRLCELARMPANEERPWWLSSCVELAPALFLDAVANATILDFAERVMGPFAQLDNLTFAAFPSKEPSEVAGTVSGWHRDIWAELPRTSAYTRPLACNAICYLQEMTPEYGPLRIIPGSHRRPLTMTPDERNRPHPQEELVPLQAGDVVFTHNGLLHSGTPNTSGKPRYFFSIYYNLSWLKHRDNHSGPNVQAILADARRRDDRRLMRLFGEDPLTFARANSGFVQPDEELWSEWAADDRAALKEPRSGA